MNGPGGTAGAGEGGLAGAAVIVTGAAGNLGRAVVRVLRAQGARVAALDRARGRLGTLFADLAGDADLLFCEDVDLTEPGSVAAAQRAAAARFGRIDGLAACAGGFAGGPPVHEEDPVTWERMLALNLGTALVCCRAVLPAMRAQGAGAIVTVAATAGLAGPPGLAAYSAAKAALLRLTESLAAENADHGIRVNAVLPAILDTPENRTAMPEADPARWVRPEAAARVIAFLLSPAACAVNGVALPLNGRG